MIYDCFIFFNEFDLLEIRLNELDNIVDKFVLVEANFTHSSKEKPYYFEENKNRFIKFSDKIIHVKVDTLPQFPPVKRKMGIYHNRHEVEHYHRNCTIDGLVDCKPNDIILISDIDEIPRVSSIIEAVELLNDNENLFVTFRQKLFYYFINGLCVQNNHAVPWLGVTACKYKSFPGPENLRMSKDKNRLVVDDSGWHFSYLGGVEEIIRKIESYSHQEFDNDFIKDKSRINLKLERGEDLFDRTDKPSQLYIELDDTFPKYILNNKEKYKHLIK